MQRLRLRSATPLALVAVALLVASSSCTTFGSDVGAIEAGVPDGSVSGDVAVSDVDAAVPPRSLYADAVMLDVPLGYWRLGEHAGSVAHSLLNPVAVDGAIVEMPKLGAPGALFGDTNTAFAFDAVGQRVEVASAQFDFVKNQPYTLEAWVKPTTIDGSFRHVFAKDNGRAGNFQRDEYGLFFYAASPAVPTLVFERYVLGTTGTNDRRDVTYTTPGSFLSQWHHLVAIYDGASMSLWVDAVEVGTTPDSRSASTKPKVLAIGAESNTGDPVAGSIDEVAIYDRALAPLRITEHYRIGRGP